MRILQVISHYVPAYALGGALRVAHSLGKALHTLGHEVRVCTTNLKDADHDLDVTLDEPINVDGVTVFYEAVDGSRYWGFSWPLARRVWREAKWADVILVHFHYQFASVAGGLIARMRHKPYVVFAHGSLNQYGVSARSTMRKRLYLAMLEAGNFRHALFTAYHSIEEMESSLSFGRGKVVFNGIDPASFAERPPPGYFRTRHPELRDRVSFLYLGRLAEGKGLELLLPAFAELVRQGHNVHLVLAGPDEHGFEAGLRRTVDRLGIVERVSFAGLIGGMEKIAVMQDTDCFVLPSRSEGLSISMLEAMYMGLPIVTTDRVGLWRQIKERGCGLVVSLDEGELTSALTRMMDAGFRREAGEQARKLVLAEHTWEHIAGRLVQELGGCIGN